jgi:nucleoside-diphosphate-sugar epimerase
MAMPDAVEAVLKLMAAPKQRLTRTVYNIGAFAPTAQQFEEITRTAFPNIQIDYSVDVPRQGIVDSWPRDVDDSAARADWHHAPRLDFISAFRDYLVPGILQRYQ